MVSSGRYIDVFGCSPQYVVFRLLKKYTAPIGPVTQGPNSIRTRDVPGLHCAEIGGRSAGKSARHLLHRQPIVGSERGNRYSGQRKGPGPARRTLRSALQLPAPQRPPRRGLGVGRGVATAIRRSRCRSVCGCFLHQRTTRLGALRRRQRVGDLPRSRERRLSMPRHPAPFRRRTDCGRRPAGLRYPHVRGARLRQVPGPEVEAGGDLHPRNRRLPIRSVPGPDRGRGTAHVSRRA